MGGQVLEYETKTIFNDGKREMAKAIALKLRKKGMSITDIADVSEENEDTIREWFEEDD